MTASRRGIYLTLALLAGLSGCNEKDPPRRYYADLGDEGNPLLPTSAPVHNFKIKNGTADWLPFRQPEIPEDAAATPQRGSSPTAGGDASANSETEKAIREAVAEYNDALATGTAQDLLEFLNEDQGKIAETLLPTLDALNTKLGELATAMPAHAEAIETVRSQLAAASLLRIEIASIKTADENTATVTLVRSPLPAFLPGLSDDAKAVLDVTFSLGDDEYWYIESPIVSALGKIEPALKRAIAEIDGLVSGAASGDPAAALAGAVMLGPMLQAVAPPAGDAEENNGG